MILASIIIGLIILVIIFGLQETLDMCLGTALVIFELFLTYCALLFIVHLLRVFEMIQ